MTGLGSAGPAHVHSSSLSAVAGATSEKELVDWVAEEATTRNSDAPFRSSCGSSKISPVADRNSRLTPATASLTVGSSSSSVFDRSVSACAAASHSS